MSTAIGVSLPRLATAVGKAISEYAVLGKTPGFTADFIKNKYPGYTSLSSAITHARSGNAVMTDGYGPELVTNGGFDSDSDWTKGTGWSIANGVATHTTTTGSYLQTSASPLTVGKTYVFSVRITAIASGTLSAYGSAYYGTAFDSVGDHSMIFTADASYFRMRSTGEMSIDNVSVREMPVLKWAPHNLVPYSEQVDSWSTGGSASTTDTETVTFTASTGDFVQVAPSTPAPTEATYTAKVQLWSETDVGEQVVLRIRLTGAADITLSVTLTDTPEWYTVSGSASGSTLVNGMRVLNSADGLAKTFKVRYAHLYRSDLGGMVDNPDQPPSRASYVPTTSSAVYLPRVGHHVYNGSAWVNEGLLAESEARVNLVGPSTDMTNSTNWPRIGVSDISLSGVGPDGVEDSANLVVSSTGGGTGVAYINKYVSSLDASSTYTWSVYAKAGTCDSIMLYTSGFTTPANNGYVFNLETGVATGYTGTPAHTATIQDVGNGWYRCALTFTTDSTDTNGFLRAYISNGSNILVDRDGTDNAYFYGAQFEKGATPSSLIITPGTGSVTRPAETFTIPSANLPWPEPNYIGSELVTNGTFDTDSDWTKGTGWTISGGQATHVAGTGSNLQQSVAYGSSGTIYALSVDVVSISGGSGSIQARTGGATTAKTIDGDTSGTTVTLIYVHDGLNTDVAITAGSGTSLTVDNISVREINPLSVSIAMDGRVTYADEGGTEAVLYDWREDSSNLINLRISGSGGRTGEIQFRQEEGGTLDVVTSSGTYLSPDVLVPYSGASRHGSTFINGATDGVALTANTTPTALVDLSAIDLELAENYMGTISVFRVWDRDLGDDGIVEATNPSLEPSLSLTFEGTGTNSFIVNDWSE